MDWRNLCLECYHDTGLFAEDEGEAYCSSEYRYDIGGAIMIPRR